MTEFIQLHLLTSYPPANLNRDDLGRPKTAMMGGVQRLRVSSQSLKRAWRTSSLFQNVVGDHIGTRTRDMGLRIEHRLTDGGMDPDLAKRAASGIAGSFGKLRGEGPSIEQLAHFSPAEESSIEELCATLLREGREPTEDEVKTLLGNGHRASDIALFGRMLADNPSCNVEAAAQVAHAISVHRSAIEDDWFSAVDDLNSGEEDLGAAHIGETGFAAGLFYIYVCIDVGLLEENLDHDDALTRATLSALVQATATVSPRGKQNSFGSRSYASFILAERGEAQPRSLSAAFLRPVQGDDWMAESIEVLVRTREGFDSTYGVNGRRYVLDATCGEGSLEQLVEFVTDRAKEPVR